MNKTLEKHNFITYEEYFKRISDKANKANVPYKIFYTVKSIISFLISAVYDILVSIYASIINNFLYGPKGIREHISKTSEMNIMGGLFIALCVTIISVAIICAIASVVTKTVWDAVKKNEPTGMNEKNISVKSLFYTIFNMMGAIIIFIAKIYFFFIICLILNRYINPTVSVDLLYKDWNRFFLSFIIILLANRFFRFVKKDRSHTDAADTALQPRNEKPAIADQNFGNKTLLDHVVPSLIGLAIASTGADYGVLFFVQVIIMVFLCMAISNIISVYIFGYNDSWNRILDNRKKNSGSVKLDRLGNKEIVKTVLLSGVGGLVLIGLACNMLVLIVFDYVAKSK